MAVADPLILQVDSTLAAAVVTGIVAVVVCNPTYTRLLKPAIPNTANASTKRQCSRANGNAARIEFHANGNNSNAATAQRQNDKPNGGTSAWIARAKLKLPAQNKIVSTSSK